MNETLITALVRQTANEMDKIPAHDPAYAELAKLLVQQDNRVLTAFRRKLIELTVRECADLFEVEYGQSEVSGNEVATVLKKHFGVNE